MDIKRYAGNIGLWAGQLVLLYFDIRIGIVVKVCASLLICHSMFKHKMWDMAITLIAFSLLDLSRLFYEFIY